MALQELLAQLEEQNITLDIRKVRDKECVYEIKMPDTAPQQSARLGAGGGSFVNLGTIA